MGCCIRIGDNRMLNEFVLGMSISMYFAPVLYIVAEILDKFYQAFVNNREE